MSEPQNVTSPDDNAYIDVVCDHCSTGYHVSIMHFKDAFKHRFDCANCGESWDEYLDIPVWENLQEPIQQMVAQQEMEQERQRAEEKRLAEEEAERVRLAEEEATRETDAALQAEEGAVEDREEDDVDSPIAKTETEALANASSDRDEGEDQEEQKDPTAGRSKSASSEGEEGDGKNEGDAAEAPKGAKKILFYLSPVGWGNFSIMPIVVAMLLVIVIIVGSGSYFFVRRDIIVEDNPLAASAYAAAGVHVSPIDGFEVNIERLERKDIVIPGERTEFEYILRTKVLNVSDRERRAPFARFSALDIQGNSLSSWDIDLTSHVLRNEEDMNIVVQIPEILIGNERVDSFAIRLISRQEREFLGEKPLIKNQSPN